MADVNDRELLAEYARNGSDRAFRALTERYLNLVYSTAVRVTRNPDDAEEVTQAVFLVLSQKAGNLRAGTVLAGWLYQTARLIATNFVRGRIRRQRREQEACMQSSLSEPDSSAWEQIAPLLEEAMGSLGETDRNAIVLRYLQDKSNREVGSALRISEAAAHQRVSRALEKLRRIFVKRGVPLSTAAITAAMVANATQAAPGGLAVAVAGVTQGAGAQGAVAVLAKEMMSAMKWAQMKFTLAAGLSAVAITAVIATALSNRSQAGGVAPVALVAPEQSVGATNIATVPQIAAAGATNYELIRIETVPGFDLHVAALNNRGQVVGSLDSATEHQTHAFVWDNRVVPDLGTFGAAKSLATGINDAGDVVGLILTNGARHVFLRRNSEVLDLGVMDQFAKLGDEGDKYQGGPGIIYYAPRVAVNSQGQVAGRLTVESGNQRSFLLNEGQTSYFGMLGDGNVFEAEAVNNRRQILGRATQGGGPMRSMLWQEGKLIDLGSLAGAASRGAAINDHGTVVGSLTFTNGTSQPFIWNNGQVRRLTMGNSQKAVPSAINNAGQIAGSARAADNRSYACLWTADALVDLNDMVKMEPGWRLTSAAAINERGQILARATKAEQRRDYLLSPMNLPLGEPAPAIAAAPPPPKSLVPVPFSLNAFERLPNGAFRLGFTGAADGKYVVEASTNLVTWMLLGPATNNGGKVEFTDNDAPHFTMRFYRATRNF